MTCHEEVVVVGTEDGCIFLLEIGYCERRKCGIGHKSLPFLENSVDTDANVRDRSGVGEREQIVAHIACIKNYNIFHNVNVI